MNSLSRREIEKRLKDMEPEQLIALAARLILAANALSADIQELLAKESLSASIQVEITPTGVVLKEVAGD